MKIVVFDVSNGNCSLVVCPKGNSLMIDCGSNTDKECPVDLIKEWKRPGEWLSEMKEHSPSYPLTLLAISHPDEDHIRNIEKVHKHLTPYLLHRRKIEYFPSEAIDLSQEAVSYYKRNVCGKYRGNVEIQPDWGFVRRSYQIPMDILVSESEFELSKVKNYSSRVYILEYKGFKMMFGGDMEEIGWEWLLDNDQKFLSDVRAGISVFLASHHGHVSGYSSRLFQEMGKPGIIILSKGSESGGETDVDSRYSQQSRGLAYTNIFGEQAVMKTLTTRTHGNIKLAVDVNGRYSVIVDNLV